jgi:hypothetical protein
MSTPGGIMSEMESEPVIEEDLSLVEELSLPVDIWIEKMLS